MDASVPVAVPPPRSNVPPFTVIAPVPVGDPEMFSVPVETMVLPE